MSNNEDTQELLYQKRDIVINMLNATLIAPLSGGENDAQIYIDLIETRQRYINKIIKIDEILNTQPHKANLSNPSPQLLLKINEIQQTIKDATKKLKEVDDKNNPHVNKAMQEMKKQIKDVNVSKNIKNIYDKDIPQTYTKINTKQ